MVEELLLYLIEDLDMAIVVVVFVVFFVFFVLLAVFAQSLEFVVVDVVAAAVFFIEYEIIQ